MIFVVQLLVFALIICSITLVVSIPVVLASPGQWEKSQNLIYTSISVWVGLIIITGIANSFVV